MINITLTSKDDVNKLKDSLKSACDSRGIRLGNSQNKPGAILAEMLGYRDFNTLLGKAIEDPIPTVSSTQDLIVFAERFYVPATTYSAAEEVKNAIEKAEGIRLIILAVRDGKYNKSATTIVLIAESGIKLFDTTLITSERSPRELELLGMFNIMKSKGVLDKVRFINQRITATNELPSSEAVKLLTTFPLVDVFPDWQGFLAMYNTELERYGDGIYYDDDWNDLRDAVKAER